MFWLGSLRNVPDAFRLSQLLQSLSEKRDKENARRIFWKHRTGGYIQRTESWDEFPNGRWGDSRSPGKLHWDNLDIFTYYRIYVAKLSLLIFNRFWLNAHPAFGEPNDYGISLRYAPAECRKMWGTPTSINDIALVFAKYCKGEIAALPWSAQQLEPETDTIRQRLAAINLLGYLTINSQPAVNGARSSDKAYGWGPKNGYVYQKAYLEFFVGPEKLDELIRKIEKDPEVTYYAINKQGDLRTNTSTKDDGPNAVTWGVFPGKEIIQPTIVEAMSFIAWKVSSFDIYHLLFRATQLGL